ncbi:MAG TPA: YwiC-like family protein [Thermoanaerobaculia bacterium]
MSTAPAQDRIVAAPRPALRPLALPNEHGGWGFLLEPLLLGLLVAPSIGGAFIGIAALFGFLTRQPLKYALQDALRGKSYARTPWCWMFAATYATVAAAAFAGAILVSRIAFVIPFGLVAPLAVTVVLYDAYNRSRSLFPELIGAAAMSSTATAIAIAGGMRMLPAFALSGIILARSLPSILYVRTLLRRAHRQTAASWPALVAQVAAAIAVAAFAPLLAVVAMVILIARAAWGLAHEPPRAKTIGWSEVAIGTITIVLAAAGYRFF